jgi:hypothetical protein
MMTLCRTGRGRIACGLGGLVIALVALGCLWAFSPSVTAGDDLPPKKVEKMPDCPRPPSLPKADVPPPLPPVTSKPASPPQRPALSPVDPLPQGIDAGVRRVSDSKPAEPKPEPEPPLPKINALPPVVNDSPPPVPPKPDDSLPEPTVPKSPTQHRDPPPPPAATGVSPLPPTPALSDSKPAAVSEPPAFVPPPPPSSASPPLAPVGGTSSAVPPGAIPAPSSTDGQDIKQLLARLAEIKAERVQLDERERQTIQAVKRKYHEQKHALEQLERELRQLGINCGESDPVKTQPWAPPN